MAKREGTLIPHLCHVDMPGYRPDGNCRACMVDIEGERVLAASCIRKPTAGHGGARPTPSAPKKSREMVFELLASNMRPADDGPDNQSTFWQWAGVDGHFGQRAAIASKFDGDDAAEFDITNPAIAVNLDACIACGACVRACREVQVNDVIGMADRGDHTIPVFDMHDPMGLSTCVTCGECVQACPTGALYEKTLMDKAGKTRAVQDFDKVVDTLCPFCGVGCQTQRGGQGQPHRPGRRPQRLRQREPALRQGPLRLRLCDVAGAADQAADPPRRRAEGRRCRPARRRSADRSSARPPGKRRWSAPPPA